MSRPMRGLMVLTLLLTLLLGHASAVSARPQIVEDQIDASGARTAIHLRILSGCQGQDIDRIELTIPEGVVGVAPEAVVGWTIETEEVATEPYELFGEELATRVGTVRWTGSLADGQFLDLGLAAVFGDAGELVFPVVQGCGTTEVSYTELVPEGTEPNEVELRAPTLAVVEPEDPIDLPALQAAVTSIEEELNRLLTDDGFIAVPKLRDEVDEIRRTVNRLRDRIDELAPEGTPEP